MKFSKYLCLSLILLGFLFFPFSSRALQGNLGRETLSIYAPKPTLETPAEVEAFHRLLHIGLPPYGYFGPQRFLKGVSVTTSPLFGTRSVYDASDLLYQYPTMNEDLLLLAQRTHFEYHLNQVGDTLDNRAIIVLSGALEGQVIYSHGFGNSNNNDVNLSTGELDVFAMMSSWANGLLAYSYDDSRPATGSRSAFAHVYLSRGFLTIGNLRRSPFYFTLGQMYLPFGRYSSALLTSPLVKSLGRILDRAALLGFYNKGLYASIYGFRGNRVNGTQFIFKQGGVNVGYQWNGGDIGAGLVSNLAASQGMQNNGVFGFPFTGAFIMSAMSQFGGFAVTPGANRLVHNFPGANLHAEIAFGKLQLIIEYVSGLERFAQQDATYNFHGALVQVGNIELDFNFTIRNTAVVVGLYAGKTWQALVFNVPESSFAIVASASFWKNTMMGLEYRYDKNYSVKPLLSATGHGLPVSSANIGGSRNTVTFQVGAYF